MERQNVEVFLIKRGRTRVKKALYKGNDAEREQSPYGMFRNNVKRKLSDFFYNVSVVLHRIRKKFVKTEKPRTMTSRRRGELAFFIALIAYPLLQFTVFYVVVNINSILLAFKTFDVSTAQFYFNAEGQLFDNFKNFISDLRGNAAMITAATNSVKLYLCTLFIAFPLNLIFSFFLYKKVPAHGFFRTVLFLPQIISALVVSLMFRYFVENALPSLIGMNLLTTKTTGFSTIIFYTIWAGFGTQILIYTSAMTKIDSSLVEFGELEGISLIREFWHITLPLIFPTITIFLVAGIAGLFTSQAGLYNFYGGSARTDLQTLGYVFFVRIIKSNDASYAQYPYAAAAGLLFTMVATPVTLLVKYALERFGPSAE